MKYIFSIIAALLLTINVYSQGLYTLNYTMGFGVSSTSDYISSPSFRGVTFDGRGFVTDNISVGGLFNWTTFYEELGGATFTEENVTITGTQYRYINAFPLLVQAHYYLSEDEYAPRFYLGVGTGAYKMVRRTNIGVWSHEYNKWQYGISPEIGLLFPVGMDTKFNLSFRYHYVVKAKETTDYSWFGLSVGFAWGD
jgi:outer membrane protein W